MAESKLRSLGGGWYELPDGERIQLRKSEVADFEAGLGTPKTKKTEKAIKVAEDENGTDEVDEKEEAAAPEDYEFAYGVQLQHEAEVGVPSPPPPVVMPEGIDDGSESDLIATPVPGSTFPIGPFTDYAFVTTPWGEFAEEKGKYITGIREVPDKNNPQLISFVADYGGKHTARGAAEREEWRRKSEAERRANQGNA